LTSRLDSAGFVPAPRRGGRASRTSSRSAVTTWGSRRTGSFLGFSPVSKLPPPRSSGSSSSRVGAYPLPPDGRLYLTSVPAGSWLLRLAAPGAAVTSATVTVPGPPVELVLPW